MPRARLRPDYVCRNYTYACRISHPVPQVLWDTARAMQALWNRLVAHHDALTTPWTEETTRDVKRQAYDAFWAEAYTLVRDEGEALGLDCWPKWHVYDTFQAAQKRWRRGQGGRPKAHAGLRRLVIPYRTASGGVPLAWLWHDTPRKHTALVLGHDRDTPGYMTMGGERVRCRVILHRLPPAEAILKRVALLGTFEPSLRTAQHDGWQWRFQLSLEMPPPGALPSQGRSAGMDVGWRVRADGLRVAVITDGVHCWEWRLPFDLANTKLRRRQRLYARHHATLESPGSWRQLWALQAEADRLLEECKAALATADHRLWPADAQALWAQAARVRAGGLRRLRRLLDDAGVVCVPLAAWASRYAVLLRRVRGAQIHLLRAREHLYRHLADWLARHFDVVSWEGDLDLHALAATDTPPEPALDASRKYRHMAGLSVLRGYVREALARYGRHLVDQKAAYTTQTCATCGAPVPPGAALVTTCVAGHAADQDVTAARNLWQALPDTERPVPPAPPGVDRAQMSRGVHRLA